MLRNKSCSGRARHIKHQGYIFYVMYWLVAIWSCVHTWSIAVDRWGARWCSGSGSLLTLVAHTPALTRRAVALQWAILSFLITLWDEGSHSTLRALQTVSVMLTLGLGTLRLNCGRRSVRSQWV